MYVLGKTIYLRKKASKNNQSKNEKLWHKNHNRVKSTREKITDGGRNQLNYEQMVKNPRKQHIPAKRLKSAMTFAENYEHWR